jgi:hypothetical protein
MSANYPLLKQRGTREGNIMRDATVEWMKANNVPLTRENYLQVAYMCQTPTEDAEMEIPAEILLAERRLIARKDREFLREIGARW